MASNTTIGVGKLYDGNMFICAVRYDIDSRDIRHGRDSGRLSVTGVLSRIPGSVASKIDAGRNTHVLQLEDGTLQNIVILNNDQIVTRGRCRIRLRGPLVMQLD